MGDKEIALVYIIILVLTYIVTFTILNGTSSLISYIVYTMIGVISFIIASIGAKKVISGG